MRAVEGRMEQQRMRRTREPELLSMNIAEAEFSTISLKGCLLLLLSVSLFMLKSTFSYRKRFDSAISVSST